MGIDFYSCERCGRGFPDVIDYVYCDCGNIWCCEECAKEDGYEYGIEVDEDGEEIYSCEGSTCKCCRKEDFSDSELLERSLKLLNMTREQLIRIEE